jgi:hypothetical protein
MNIKKITEIVNLPIPEEMKKSYIIDVLAQDKTVIPTILKILEEERYTNKELLLDTNLELSRALVVLKDKNLKWDKNIITDPKWVIGEIIKHYQKWKNYIGCCFNIKELNEGSDNGTDDSSSIQNTRGN